MHHAELALKPVAAGIAAIAGGTTMAAADAVTGAGGIEKHLTLATAAVAVVAVLWACLTWLVKTLLKAKDDQIAALRIREQLERERANAAEQALRDHLKDAADPHDDPRHSRR